MKSFTYTIADPVGIHARPAGILVKEIKQYSDVTVTIAKDGKSTNAIRLMALIGMGIKQGDEVTVSVEGKNEDEVAGKIEEFFKTYF
ncbi:MAG: HPr family phosphocarrier protein [Oscillospiraceae bacterium]|nr:HPr family phosphocarrier protein [Oscillospiraceae bacterium]